ncbi:cation:proton antiporter [Glaciecola sp. 2405UD65-10]|uniref:cation:proton antiporter n=1 Tax=Glaciecola sp. 2405UD65-10 TaxID=3397244 RepID=UPI003B595597
MNDLTLPLALVGIISIACQFFAFKIKIPAILPLLIIGIIVGPVAGIIDADAIFGDLLFPIVSLSVAIILFEGALTLKFKDISGHGSMVRNLCTIGTLVTLITVAPVAHYALGIPWELSFLFAALVTVTGPTVIVPMLRTVRPSAKVSNILRWEGIIIDPIGALLAVIVFEYIISTQNVIGNTFLAFAKTVGVGTIIGALSGYLMGLALRYHWIPHYLTNTAVLTIMLGVFAASNLFAHESGLITVTIMGMILTNMRGVDVDDILEFKETLSVLLISGLFILLASRIDLSGIAKVGIPAVVVLLVIMFVSRPLSVVLSSVNAKLNWREIALLSWIAPRGIVAAAVSALFSLKLEAIDYPQAELLVPMVFLVIIVTVVVQSLSSAKVAELLKIRSPEPNGVLMFGGGLFSRLLAKELQDQKIPVCLSDTNWETIKQARMDGIPCYFGNPISEHASRNLDVSLFSKVLVLSPYKQLNPLVTFHFEHELGKGAVLGLNSNESQNRPSHQVSESYTSKLTLFSEDASYGKLIGLVNKGAVIKTTGLSETFTYQDYEKEYEGRCIPLCAITGEGKVKVFTTTKDRKPKADWRIVSLIIAK